MYPKCNVLYPLPSPLRVKRPYELVPPAAPAWLKPDSNSQDLHSLMSEFSRVWPKRLIS